MAVFVETRHQTRLADLQVSGLSDAPQRSASGLSRRFWIFPKACAVPILVVTLLRNGRPRRRRHVSRAHRPLQRKKPKLAVVALANKIARYRLETHGERADSEDGAHVFRSDAAQRSDLIARRWST
ncbi:MAG: hypothetical protein EOS40_29085 [Mesorhizobium sp.]|nr:MAG: hypothetical protein EOS75_30805 [Mesorhizobium sp.]RWD97291.1 MAG: hypothetical protein EOS40_29085 [Mesorhizobium sp.]